MYRGSDILKIYDEEFNNIGTRTREEVHRKGLLHQVAHIWMFQWSGDDAYIMIQKRSRKRELFPGKYDLLQTTHFEPEQSYEDAIRDSLKYYLGAKLSNEDITHLGSLRQHIDKGDYHDNALIQVFAITVKKALFIMPDTENILKVRFDDFSLFIRGKLRQIAMYSLDDVCIRYSRPEDWWLRSEEFIDAVEPYIDSKIQEHSELSAECR